MRSAFLVLVLAGAASIHACRSATAPRPPAAVQVPSAEATLQNMTANIRVVFRVANLSSDPIRYQRCGGKTLEMRTNGPWQQIWSEPCLLQAPVSTRVIEPGEVLEDTARIHRSSPATSTDVWLFDGAAREYRLVVGLLSPAGAPLSLTARTSTTFQISAR